MNHIIALSGSNSKKSINSMLLQHIMRLIDSDRVIKLSLVEDQFPMYSIDLEQESGIPIPLQVIKNKISESSALIIAVNEHNGMISAFFKNILGWLSRADRNFLASKKILLLSTSPGKRGGASALEYMKNTIPRYGGVIVESFSFPSFYDHYDVEHLKITDPTMELGVKEVVASFMHQLS